MPVLRLDTACEDASFSTVKVSDPVSAPAEALAATLVEELVAFVVVQRSGLRAASAAAVTARKVVLTVRYAEPAIWVALSFVFSAVCGPDSACMSWLIRLVVSMPDTSPSTLMLMSLPPGSVRGSSGCE